MSTAIRPAHEDDPFKGGATFTLRHRLIRLLWGLVWGLFAAWTPPPMRRWRRLLLVAFGADLHPTANVYGSVKVWYPPNLKMGPYSTMGPGVICYSMDRIEIGSYAVISQRAHLCCGTHDINNPDFQLYSRPIKIEPHAWICAEAFVGPGVIIGEGAVLSARGATFSDLDNWSVWRGNPAVRVKDRPRFERDNT